MATSATGQVVPNGSAPGTYVTGQQEQVGLNSRGQAENGYRVSFTTGGGVDGSVFVPISQYTPDNVKAAIVAHASQLDQVQRMRL